MKGIRITSDYDSRSSDDWSSVVVRIKWSADSRIFRITLKRMAGYGILRSGSFILGIKSDTEA